MMAGGPLMGSSTLTNISGRMAKPGLSATSRTLRVRVAGSNWGSTGLTSA